MKVLICFKHLKDTSALDTLNEKIRSESHRLEELIPRAVVARWACAVDNGLYMAEATLLGPRTHFHAHAKGDSLYRGIDQVVAKITKQILKWKGSCKKYDHRKVPPRHGHWEIDANEGARTIKKAA